ncbi:unnamed protein product [Bursaphelenchus okinawaensis]|uniref:Aldehyde dehydrogenase n=1 Tax=Bursaphelenchus okinawaensis TaxID=465554 RepID=A0A811LG27_9BILA|nr:unnamed protein product [Bursaphelenchus okinawaensis]CAG9121793.1 unnamed protein product [Bursaphelenchus okinawaensis]
MAGNSDSDYKQILSTLREGFVSGANGSLENRKNNLTALKNLITENEEAICSALWEDLRKSQFESIAHETGHTISEISTALSNLKAWTAPEKVARFILQAADSAYIVSEPLGVCLIIGAWNFPLQLLLAPLVGALAAGNTVFLKPSDLAPATEKCFLELFPKYLKEDVVKVVSADKDQMSEILQLRFDHIFFTGSTAIGKIVMKSAAEHLSPVTLELGGKSPAIIDNDCDLNITARRVMWGKLLNVGQVCVAPDYVILIGDQERKDKFVEECVKNIKEFYGENAKDSEDYGRIINTRHFDRLSKVLEASTGKVLYGGASDRDEKYIEPTIIDALEDDSTLQDELFGPILPILTVPALDDAIKYVNRHEKPLVAYLFSGRKNTVERVQNETSSGTLTINDTIMHMTLETLPFGGVGHSGMGGKYHGKASFDVFSHKKSVMHRTAGFEKLLWMRYPPFSADKLAWARRLTMKIKLPF